MFDIEKEFEDIYLTLTGNREDEYCIPGVEDAFAPGSLCAQEYDTMRAAYERICQRLGVQDEDSDLDQILFSMEAIQKELCRRIWGLR